MHISADASQGWHSFHPGAESSVLLLAVSLSFYHAYNRRDLPAMMAEIADDVFYEDLVRRGTDHPRAASSSTALPIATFSDVLQLRCYVFLSHPGCPFAPSPGL